VLLRREKRRASLAVEKPKQSTSTEAERRAHRLKQSTPTEAEYID
jgi:hypothetical protein